MFTDGSSDTLENRTVGNAAATTLASRIKYYSAQCLHGECMFADAMAPF